MVIFAVMILLEIQNASFLPDAIKKFDYSLFAKMNGQWHNSFVDTFMIFIREPTVWVPLYFFLVVFIGAATPLAIFSGLIIAIRLGTSSPKRIDKKVTIITMITVEIVAA